MRLSDYIFEFVEYLNIDTVFTVSGGGSIYLCDSLSKNQNLKYVSCHHEQGAIFAAEGYSRSKNQVGACLVTTGPGGTNIITGLNSAYVDSFWSQNTFESKIYSDFRWTKIYEKELD